MAGKTAKSNTRSSRRQQESCERIALGAKRAAICSPLGVKEKAYLANRIVTSATRRPIAALRNPEAVVEFSIVQEQIESPRRTQSKERGQPLHGVNIDDLTKNLGHRSTQAVSNLVRCPTETVQSVPNFRKAQAQPLTAYPDYTLCCQYLSFNDHKILKFTRVCLLTISAPQNLIWKLPGKVLPAGRVSGQVGSIRMIAACGLPPTEMMGHINLGGANSERGQPDI